MLNYRLITGHYYVVGYSPDADSIKFKADNPQLWQTLETDHYDNFVEKFDRDDGIITLRLQGIDGIETHYVPPGVRPPKALQKQVKASKLPAPPKGNHHQPEAAGQAATDILLGKLGVLEPVWRKWGRRTWVDKAQITRGHERIMVTDKYEDAIPGYIITGNIEKNGRPLSWVFAGKAPVSDGTILSSAEVSEMAIESINYILVEQGMVYPYFYKNLSAKLRTRLADAAQTAQENAHQGSQSGNVWSMDNSRSGIVLPDLSVLYHDEALFPYVFRRIVNHWYMLTMARYYEAIQKNAAAGPTGEDLSLNLDGFFKNGNPWVFVISQQEFTRLNTILEIKQNSLRWHVYPYDIVFLS